MHHASYQNVLTLFFVFLCSMYDLPSGIYDLIGNPDDILTLIFGAKPIMIPRNGELQIRCNQFFTQLLFEKNVPAKRRVSIFFDNTTNANVNVERFVVS
ncbi:hypothetical protein DVH24_019455 [Malus domestica]|uniref:Uncharacterized protein n=1 Tax=Malus domestica TaxID=3750 RepID=A0A498I3S4_MALDO|nr:hypothetical protein DVH24_019455 [Malus domestica]